MKTWQLAFLSIWMFVLADAVYMKVKQEGLNVRNFIRHEPPLKQEYSIELINQDTVKVYSHSTQKLYTVPFNSIDSVLLIDNL